MPFRWVETPGTLEIEIEGPDERAVFVEGFGAMCELLAGDVAERGVTRTVELAGRDRAALLADWLAELAILGDTEGLVPERLADLELGEEGLRATVEGGRGTPGRTLKGANYDRLALERSGEGWVARAVLDR